MPERTIIAGYDGREQALDGLALASVLARRQDTRLLVVSVYPQEPRDGEYQDALRAIAESSLMSAARHIPYGVRFETRAIPGRHAGQALVELAEHEGAEAIVVGSCHRGTVGSVLLGSVSEHLSRNAGCAVAIAPRGYAESGSALHTIAENGGALHTIAVGFDGGPESWQALDRAAGLAGSVGARLRLIAVLDAPGPGYGSVISAFTYGNLGGARRDELEQTLDEAVARVRPGVEVSAEMLFGPPAASLVEACGHGVDLLVTGSRGYGPLRRTLLGGVSVAIMRSARCPVLVVPRSSVAGGAKVAA
jgi:nucleotide-binding universal stress UspA family protein